MTVANAQESARSDGAQTYAQPVEHPSVYSPQVEAMMRYDNSNVNLNTGTVSLTVPLVEFDDPDFDLDVSLTYSSDGFKPLQPDNYVGMGWRLDCGGVITREVNGIPDEFMNITTDGGFVGCYEIPDLMGFRMGTPADASFMDKLLNPGSLDGEFQHAYLEEGTRKIVVRKNSNTEMSPDVYRFRFGRHSGSFMYNLDGTLKVISDNGGHYVIDFLNDCIRIITDDGYHYYFGESSSALEYTALSWKDFTDGHASAEIYIMSNRRHKREITAYHLTRIVAPNGRELTYSYLTMPSATLHDDPVRMFDNSFYTSTYRVSDYQKCYQAIPAIKGEHSDSNLDNCTISYSLNKVALISNISTGDKSVSFTYGNYSSPHFSLPRQIGSGPYMFVSGCGAKLTSVNLSYSTSGYNEEVELDYDENRGRLLLTDIRNSKNGLHHLQYNSEGTFRNSITIDIDKWGFWSGTGANTSIRQMTDPLRSSQINDTTGCFYRDPNDTNREPSGEEYDVYMLHKVTYPTGGCMTYEYEPHTYSKYIYQPYSHYEPLTGTDSTKIAGGARIRRIVHEDLLSSLKRVRCYQYDEDDGTSSGFLRLEGENYLKPFPYSVSKHNNTGYFVHSIYTESYKILRQASLGGYISYRKVEEFDYESAAVKNIDKSLPHKVTEFIEPFITPQQTKAFVSDVISLDIHGHFPYHAEHGFLTEYYAYRGDYSNIFGKICSESYYTRDSKLQKKVEYEYECLNQDFGYFIHGYPAVSGSVVGCYSHVAKVPFFQHLMTEVKTTEYDTEGRSSSHSISYSYDNMGYKTSASETDSEGRTITTSYKYPKDVRDTVCVKMRMLNFMAPIVEVIVTSDDEVIYKRHNDYKLNNGYFPVPPADTSLEPPTGSYPVIKAVYDTYGNEAPEKQVEYLSYDRYGNPLWIRSHGRDYVYVWGRFGQDLLVMVQGASEDEVADALGVEYLDDLSMQGEPADGIGATIRAALPNSLVTSYTYLPGAGMSSQTSPDGQTIYYEYDDKGRLSYIYRKDGDVKSIIEKYDYNLVNE